MTVLDRFYKYSLIAVLATAILFTQCFLAGASAHAPYYDDSWPFDLSRGSLMERALGVDDSDVSFIINDRPVIYRPPNDINYEDLKNKLYGILKQSGLPEEDRVLAQHGMEKFATLEKMVRDMGNPRISLSVSGPYVSVHYLAPTISGISKADRITNMEKLVILEQKFGHKTEAENLLKQIINEKEELHGYQSMEVAQLCCVLAGILRSNKNYAAATYYYKKALDIKSKILNTDSPEIAAIYMDLANTYYDALDTKEAQIMLDKANQIMAGTAFISASYTSSARPIPTSIYAPTKSHWEELTLDTGKYADALNLAKVQREAEISALAALFKNLPERIIPKPPAGTASVYGTAQLPQDIKEIITITKKYSDTEEVQRQEVQESKKIKDAPALEVALCTFKVHDEIANRIRTFANKYGFDIDKGFCKSWPGIKQQASELLTDMSDAVVNNLAMPLVETDHAGEFQIKNVPEGKYFLYCSMLTKDEASCWLIPVTLKKGKPTRIDILLDNKTSTLWEKNRANPTAKPL